MVAARAEDIEIGGNPKVEAVSHVSRWGVAALTSFMLMGAEELLALVGP